MDNILRQHIAVHFMCKYTPKRHFDCARETQSQIAVQEENDDEEEETASIA